MISVIFVILNARFGSQSLKVKDIFFGSEERLKAVVGQRTSNPKEPGIRFAHPGYYEVWVDSPGSNMKHLRMGLTSLPTWTQYITQLGLGSSHAKAVPESTPNGPIPLFRHKLAITGVAGLPKGGSGKPWNVTFVEFAVANKAKLRQMKLQIQTQPVGEGRNRIIRGCYDWYAQLDFTKP